MKVVLALYLLAVTNSLCLPKGVIIQQGDSSTIDLISDSTFKAQHKEFIIKEWNFIKWYKNTPNPISAFLREDIKRTKYLTQFFIDTSTYSVQGYRFYKDNSNSIGNIDSMFYSHKDTLSKCLVRISSFQCEIKNYKEAVEGDNLYNLDLGEVFPSAVYCFYHRERLVIVNVKGSMSYKIYNELAQSIITHIKRNY